jgi:NAD(P)H-hydrate epimerase
MVDPTLLGPTHIITPHSREMNIVEEKLAGKKLVATILLKGPIDTITSGEQSITIEGGNAGMTKGGTGDVLAGLVAALYCTNDALTACVVGSYINKKAGEKLYEKVGPNFNASDLLSAIPETLWSELLASQQT